MFKRVLLTSILGTVMTIFGAVAEPTAEDLKTASSKAYVDTAVATKQVKIPAAGQTNGGSGETVMTYTVNGNGEIGERGLYSDASSYNPNTDGDKLITASALNATFTNLPTTDTTKLECANQDCTLWTIVDQSAYGKPNLHQMLVNGNLADGTNNWIVPMAVSYTTDGNYGVFSSSASSVIYVRCSTNGSRIAGHKYAYFLTAKKTNEGSVSSFGTRNAGPTRQITTTERTICILDTFPDDGSGEPWISFTSSGVEVYINKLDGGMRMYDLTALGLEETITTAEKAIAYFGE